MVLSNCSVTAAGTYARTRLALVPLYSILSWGSLQEHLGILVNQSLLQDVSLSSLVITHPYLLIYTQCKIWSYSDTQVLGYGDPVFLGSLDHRELTTLSFPQMIPD